MLSYQETTVKLEKREKIYQSAPTKGERFGEDINSEIQGGNEIDDALPFRKGSSNIDSSAERKRELTGGKSGLFQRA